MENQVLSKYSNPAAYIKVFFRRKWFFIAPTFFGLVIGIVLCFLLPRTWQATTIIMVEEEKMINPLIQNLAVSTTAVQRMHSIRETLLSWTSLVELTQKLNLAKSANTQLEFENLIQKLRRNIVVQMSDPGRGQVAANSIVRISYLSENPQEAQLVAKTLTDILMEKNLESQTKETDVAVNFITEQLSIYKRKIKESEIAKMQEDLKTLLADSTEQHPIVRELRQKIAAAEKELASGEYEVKGAGQALDSATKEALKTELDKIIEKESSTPAMPKVSYGGTAEPQADPNASIYKLLLMDKVDSALARDMDVNEAIYNMLLQKLETAKITQRLEVSKEGTRYTILDPARLPLVPVKPNKSLVVLMGLFAGAAAGVGLVFGREFMDQSIIDLQDAKITLDLPVLAGISRITTQEEKDKERAKKRTLIATSVIIAVISIVSAMLFAFFKR